MLIVYTISEKVFLGQAFPEEYDPLTGMSGVEMVVFQKYISCFWIPLHGTRKMVKAYSINSKQPIPVLLWTDSMKNWADGMLPLARGAWTKRLFLPIFLVALVLAIGWVAFSATVQSSNRKMQTEYIHNPVPGDIVLAKVVKSYYKYPSTPSSLVVFKIMRISGDSLIISRSPQQINTMELYRTKDRNKLLSQFDLDDESFSGEPEVYNIIKYKAGDERLRRIIREGLSRAEQEQQDQFIRYTDIIEPIFIKRPQ